MKMNYLICLLLLLITKQTNATYNQSSLFGEELCDLTTEGGICIYDGQKIILPDARPKDIIGHWSFDDGKGLDSSGSKNHAKNSIEAGPSFGGIGSSAYFNGYNYLEIPNSPDFDSKIFSLTFWVYLIKEMTEDIKAKRGLRWCPILHKGVDDQYQNIFFRSPAIFFDRKERGLKIALTTSSLEKYPQGEVIFSNARLPYYRWTHIAVVATENKLKLYVNGILDAVNATEGKTTINDMSLFVGGAPWHVEDCNVPSYIDELRFYKRKLNEEEIEAEAAPALGGIEPNFINLGCINCGLEAASKSCLDGYHICTSVELHTGGYQVARAMGWIDWNSNVWSHGAIVKKEDNSEVTGIGICCADIK